MTVPAADVTPIMPAVPSVVPDVVPPIPGKPWMMPHKPIHGEKPWPFMLKPHPKLFPFPCPLPWKMGWKHKKPWPLPFEKPFPILPGHPLLGVGIEKPFGHKPFPVLPGHPLIGTMGGGFPADIWAWKLGKLHKFGPLGALSYKKEKLGELIGAKESAIAAASAVVSKPTA
jgi:hypothetical protein